MTKILLVHVDSQYHHMALQHTYMTERLPVGEADVQDAASVVPG